MNELIGDKCVTIDIKEKIKRNPFFFPFRTKLKFLTKVNFISKSILFNTEFCV